MAECCRAHCLGERRRTTYVCEKHGHFDLGSPGELARSLLAKITETRIQNRTFFAEQGPNNDSTHPSKGGITEFTTRVARKYSEYSAQARHVFLDCQPGKYSGHCRIERTQNGRYVKATVLNCQKEKQNVLTSLFLLLLYYFTTRKLRCVLPLGSSITFILSS